MAAPMFQWNFVPDIYRKCTWKKRDVQGSDKKQDKAEYSPTVCRLKTCASPKKIEIYEVEFHWNC